MSRVADQVAGEEGSIATETLSSSLRDETSLDVNAHFAIFEAQVYMRLAFTRLTQQDLIYLPNFRNPDPAGLLTLLKIVNDLRGRGMSAIVRS